jgi:hypothetical protein
LAASGAPVLIIILYGPGEEKLVDYIFDGIVSLAPYQSHSQINSKYVNFWMTLDPLEFPSDSDDRSRLTPYGPYVVDAVISLALAFQETINDQKVLSLKDEREYTYERLIEDVQFDGTSGSVGFDANGDLKVSTY